MHRQKLPARSDVLVKHPVPAWVQMRSHGLTQLRSMRQKSVDDLLLMGMRCELLIRNLRIQQNVFNRSNQRGDFGWFVRHQWVMKAVGRNRQAAPARKLRKDPGGNLVSRLPCSVFTDS